MMTKGLLSMYWDSSFTLDQRQQQMALRFLKEIQSKDHSKAVQNEIQAILSFKDKFAAIENFKLKPFSLTQPFDDELFDKELETQAARIQEVTAVAEDLIKTGIPEIVILTSESIGQIYQEFGRSILDLTPMGMEPAFVESFKKAMHGMGSGLVQRGLTYQTQGKQLITKNRTQTAYNHLLTHEKHLREKFRYRYIASELIAPLDYSQSEAGGK